MVCALEIERRALSGLERPGVEIHVSGMGPDAAKATADQLATRAPRSVIATGFCGALTPLLDTGTLIVAERVVHENTGDAFTPDAVLLAAAPGRRGTLVSVSTVARLPADRAALTGLAVDMESASIARVMAQAEIPFIALRAVTDRYRDRIPDIVDMLDPFGNPDRGRLARYALRRPRDLVRLMQLGRASKKAGRAMAEGVGTLLERLGA